MFGKQIGKKMNIEELEKEVENKTAQYMNEYEEKYNCENTKLETDNYNAGLEQGYEDGYLEAAEPREKRISELEEENKKIKSLLKEIYEEYGFCELVKIRNDLPLEVQEAIKIFK